jgi:hypothetical protein
LKQEKGEILKGSDDGKSPKASNSEEKGLFPLLETSPRRGTEGRNDIKLLSYSKYISLKSLVAFYS